MGLQEDMLNLQLACGPELDVDWPTKTSRGNLPATYAFLRLKAQASLRVTSTGPLSSLNGIPSPKFP
jgi:hypothetical protein